MSTEIFTLGDFPTVIEPMLMVLEATGGPRSSSDLLRLKRISQDRVHQFCVLPNSLIHFFGDSDDDTVRQILCYTASGRLSHFLFRVNDTDWELTELPAEITGDKIVYPSARLVFKDERSRAVFLHYLQQVKDGKINNPSVSLMLESLVEPIRQIDVWGDHTDDE